MGLRLNLGSGGRNDTGWMHVDRSFPPPVGFTAVLGEPATAFVQLDIVRDAWPWADGSVEGIVMHHVLDLMAADEMRAVLANCYRVLQPGGVLRVSCADIVRGIERAMSGDWSWCREPIESVPPTLVFRTDVIASTPQIDAKATLGHFILQGGARKQLLTPESFREIAMIDIGFRYASEMAAGPRPGEWITELDDRADESWFAKAVK